MSDAELLASVVDLHIRFGDRTVVDGVSFEIAPGECLALVGESGSGKTITSRALLGLVPGAASVSAKQLDVAGSDVRTFDERQWQGFRGRQVGLVAQDALVSLDPLRTIGREVGEVLRVHSSREKQPLTRAALADAVEAELAHVAIPEARERARQHAHELSGGLRQRALIASATIARPRLLIADEPTTALDLGVQAQVLELLDRLKREGTGLLLISHDLAVVARIADRVAVMQGGRIVETGDVDRVLSAPEHPYTRSLLAAIPSLHTKGARLSALPPLTLAPPAVAIDTSRTVLSVRGVSQSFAQPGDRRLQAVDDVSFELTAGRTLGIVGESGSGKTTLGRIIMGFQKPESGEVLLEDAAWSTLPERRRRDRRHTIQAVYQDPLSSFDPRRNAGAILREALALGGVPRAERHARAEELAEQVGLSPDLLARRPLTLSGGQRQRVAIARALARSPRVLLCDEPVSALDVSIQAQVLDVFADIQEQLGLAMVFISHDLGVVHHVSDDVLVMRNGVVVERGPSDAVFADPQHPYTRSLLTALSPSTARSSAPIPVPTPAPTEGALP